MKLQVNTSGAWKTVVDFDESRREEVIAAAQRLAEAADEEIRWSVLHDNEKREWL